jgi:hypothetical protein
MPRIVEALRAPRPRHAVLLRCARHRQDRAGEHIAQALQRPLIVRQASDLMPASTSARPSRTWPHVRRGRGRTKAVLLLDEADSFLRSRRGAERNYEVTEVNEMLQGMERFATASSSAPPTCFDRPRRGGLAALHLQDPFKPLTANSAKRMFVAEALAGDGPTALTAEQRARLARLEQLCPGDFAAVKRQKVVAGVVHHAGVAGEGPPSVPSPLPSAGSCRAPFPA